MNTFVTSGDMLNLEDGQKVLSEFNELVPGAVDKVKQVIRKQLAVDTKAGLDVDTMVDEALLLVASYCARNNTHHIDGVVSNISEEDVFAKVSATTTLLAITSFALTALDLVNIFAEVGVRKFENSVPPHERDKVYTRCIMQAVSVHQALPTMQDQVCRIGEVGIDTAQEVTSAVINMIITRGKSDLNARKQ